MKKYTKKGASLSSDDDNNENDDGGDIDEYDDDGGDNDDDNDEHFSVQPTSSQDPSSPGFRSLISERFPPPPKRAMPV